MKEVLERLERPVCHVVAGPNGSGKLTFALRYLPEYAGAVEYVNPDLMAQGMSPTDIRLSAIKAGKLTLERIAELIALRTSFAFETTLAYLGLISVETPSLGILLRNARSLFMQYPYMLIFPAVIVSVITITFYLAGNAFSDACDPRNHM